MTDETVWMILPFDPTPDMRLAGEEQIEFPTTPTTEDGDEGNWVSPAQGIWVRMAEAFDRSLAPDPWAEIASLKSALAEQERVNGVMRAALETLADMHVPDQPADSAGDERSWAYRHVGRMRGIERKPLFQKDGEDPETYAALVAYAERENEALMRAETAEAGLARAVELIADLIFAAETSETCLKSWNDGQGGPANVEGIVSSARAFLESENAQSH